MSSLVKRDGTWQEGFNTSGEPLPLVKRDGVWGPPQQIFGKKDDVWRLLWPEDTTGGGGTVTGADISGWDGSEYFVFRGAGGLHATLQFTVSFDGEVYVAKNGAAATDEGAWLQSGLLASDYEIMATGDFTSGTMGAWIDLGTGPFWTADLAPVAVQDFSLSLQIRDKATLTVQSAATIIAHLEAGT